MIEELDQVPLNLDAVRFVWRNIPAPQNEEPDPVARKKNHADPG